MSKYSIEVHPYFIVQINTDICHLALIAMASVDIDMSQIIIGKRVEESNISFELDFPLHYLSRIGDHFRVQNFLMSKRDELFRKDFLGRSPLHYAVTTGNSSLELKTKKE